AQPSRGILMGLSIAVDCSAGPNRGRIYVSFVDQGDRNGLPNPDAANPADKTAHDNTYVFVIASDTVGKTWIALAGSDNATEAFTGLTAFARNQGVVVVKVNDATGTSSQFFAWIDVDDTTGNVAISWYDARNDDGTLGKNKQLDTVANDEVEYFATFR